MNLKTSQKGFTIVELLIVIVVIAILAAISIVAYVGIQNNARASERQSDAANIAKVAETINANTGSYPVAATTGEFTVPSGGSGDINASLPANIRVADPIASGDAAIPNTEAGYGHSTTSGVKTYKWRTCGANTGIVVYYWDPRTSGGGGKTVSAGEGCTP